MQVFDLDEDGTITQAEVDQFHGSSSGMECSAGRAHFEALITRTDENGVLPMTIATAHVPTTNASKYLQQLCKHWGHRLQVDFQMDKGTVRFPDAVATMTATESELVVSVKADSEETLDRIKGVVVSHLDRFAFREAPLQFHWSVA